MSADPSRWRRAAAACARWAPWVVPPVYLALLLDLVPEDHFGPPDAAPRVGQILYDDVDVAVMAQRGLNAHLGRSAGRLEGTPQVEDADFDKALDEGRPLEPRYFLEYPHTALLLFRLGFVLQPTLPPVPVALLDASHGNFIRHRPRDDAERSLWRCFRRAATIYRCLMGACLLALIAVCRAGYDPKGRLSSSGLLLLLPGSLYFTFNRFDIVPALCVALSLASLGRRRPAASGFFLALGALVKVYPAVLVPLLLRYLWPDSRAMAKWTLAFVATGVVFTLTPLLREGRQAIEAPYRNQVYRRGDVEPKWTAYGYILPERLADNDFTGRTFRLGSLVLAAGLLCIRRLPDLESLVRRGGVLLVVFVTLPVFYSPQWILWLAPLLLPLTRCQRGLAPLIFALDVLSFGTWPAGLGGDSLYEARVYARFVLLGAIAGLLLWGDRVTKPPEVNPGTERRDTG